MRRTSRAPIRLAILIAAVALAACEAEAPAPAARPPAKLALLLGQPAPDGAFVVYPVGLQNTGTIPLAEAHGACSYVDEKMTLLFSGQVRADDLQPGETRPATIRVPKDIAARIRGLSCRPVT